MQGPDWKNVSFVDGSVVQLTTSLASSVEVPPLETGTRPSSSTSSDTEEDVNLDAVRRQSYHLHHEEAPQESFDFPADHPHCDLETSQGQATIATHGRLCNLWVAVPPRNFGVVHPGVYRSGFPTTENLPFLAEKRIRTIITFVPEVYTSEQTDFIRRLGIKHIRIPIGANKDTLQPRPHTPVVEAIGQLLDRSNYPILIHCNKGKHRTGCVVACYRKVLGWNMTRVLQEYHHYAGIKARLLDESFIDSFDERAMQIVAVRTHLIDSYNEPASDSPIASLIPNSRLRG